MATHATTDNAWSPLNTTDDIVAAIRAGEMVVILDDEERENEGDLIMAATKVRAEDINFMAKYGRGLICLTLTRARCEQLRLPLMVSNTDIRANHELHDLDRSGRRRDDGHLGARPRAHDAGGRRAEGAAARSAPARPHLSADGAARRRADARRAHGSRLRPRAARRPRAGRRHRRDLERRRRDGASRRSRQIRAAPRARRSARSPTSSSIACAPRSRSRSSARPRSRRSSARSGSSASRTTSIAPCISRSCAGKLDAKTPTLVRVHRQDTLSDVLGLHGAELCTGRCATR